MREFSFVLFSFPARSAQAEVLSRNLDSIYLLLCFCRSLCSIPVHQGLQGHPSLALMGGLMTNLISSLTTVVWNTVVQQTCDLLHVYQLVGYRFIALHTECLDCDDMTNEMKKSHETRMNRVEDAYRRQDAKVARAITGFLQAQGRKSSRPG